jgi:YD repeat-containing protein
MDLWKMTDRLGRVTTYNYDQNRRLTSVTEPVTVGTTATTRTTKYTYYNDGSLKDLIDAKNNVTHYERDIQSRVTAKTYGYGSATAKTETYTYDSASRLKSVTDAKGQVQTIAYNADDTTANVSYVNAAVPTPGVSFTYDPYFLRQSSMTDSVWNHDVVLQGIRNTGCIAGGYRESTV